MPHPLLRTALARVLVTALATALTTTLTSVATSLPAAAAAAHTHDDGARAEGRCARGIWWRMEAEHDDGRIELEVEVDTRRAGQRWSWVLLHNGSLSDRGTSRTRGTSRSFEIERTAVDVAGTDTFRLRVRREAVVCVAHVAL